MLAQRKTILRSALDLRYVIDLRPFLVNQHVIIHLDPPCVSSTARKQGLRLFARANVVRACTGIFASDCLISCTQRGSYWPAPAELAEIQTHCCLSTHLNHLKQAAGKDPQQSLPPS
jgi:hypothetical protein